MPGSYSNMGTVLLVVCKGELRTGQDRTSLKACVFPRIRFVMFTAILSLRYRAQYLAVLTHVCDINPYIILSRCGADAAFWALHGTRAH